MRNARRVNDSDARMHIQVMTLSQATRLLGLSRSMMTDAATNAALRGTMNRKRRSHTAVVAIGIGARIGWLTDSVCCRAIINAADGGAASKISPPPAAATPHRLTAATSVRLPAQ